MPALNSAPTPKQFATAWTRHFAKAVRDAAGSDGQLCRAEAAQIAKRTDALGIYGDNAVNYLDAKGQDSVDVDTLISSGYRYAYALAAKVAGKGNRVSLVEARNLPADPKADFFALRGRETPSDGPSDGLTGKALTDALSRAAITPNGDPLTYTSEGDMEVLPIVAKDSAGVALTGPNVIALFEELLSGDEFFGWRLQDGTALTDIVVSELSANPRLWTMKDAEEETDDFYHNLAVGFAQVSDVLSDNLTDLVSVRIGPKSRNGDGMAVDSGVYAEMALGRTADGNIAGVYYGSVET